MCMMFDVSLCGDTVRSVALVVSDWLATPGLSLAPISLT